MLGLLSMYISGIDLHKVFHQWQVYEERDSDNKRAFPCSFLPFYTTTLRGCHCLRLCPKSMIVV